MRRPMKIVATAFAAALLAAPAALAQDGQPHDSARGGGQVVLDPDSLEAAGDTVGFEAQVTTTGVQGNFEYVQTNDAGEEMDRWSGVVTCLEVDGDTALIGGEIRSDEGSNVSGNFEVEVEDNGTPDEGEADSIVLEYGEETEGDCDGEFDNPQDLVLARGNAEVNDA